MSSTFSQLHENQRRLTQQSDNLREEIRVQSIKTMAIIDRLMEILYEDQRRREEERQRLLM